MSSTLDRRTGTKDVIRLMRGPWHVGSLMKLSNGRWGIADRLEKTVTKLSFQQPAMARDKFDELFPDEVPHGARKLDTQPSPTTPHQHGASNGEKHGE